MGSFWYQVACVVSMVLILIQGSHGGRSPHLLGRRVFKFMYQFGDSLADTGNVVRLVPNVSACSTFPYAETYFGHPTRCCSDGLLMCDFFAMALGLPFLEPYLETDADFKHGANFAMSGATALDTAFLLTQNIIAISNDSLSVELDWFKTHLQSISTSSTKRRAILRRSLVFMGEIGGDDINFALTEGHSIQSIYSLIPYIVEAIQNAIQLRFNFSKLRSSISIYFNSIPAGIGIVINEGALYAVVPGNFPIGCLPIYVASFASNDTSNYDDNKCIKNLNLLVQFQNLKIKEAIRKLRKQNPGVIIKYADYYNAYLRLIENATSLGFEKDKVFNACCGSEANGCGNEGAPLCENPKTFISWDGLHPTHQANKHMVEWVLPRILLY